ncbi:hypothetical protein [Mycobacterium sp. ACS4331]|uniref:hypothetical protein n=1 Tax=Mycobacterium sp. ACS4331 TaxID=1834121 RepID=UPI0008024810|nr:hypothetical protein [Mycobacterium sp. ACS4331]OBF28643.1 hypothetical protein A5727_24725 [Mycobacterium sp. ACS4331]
MHYVDSIFRVLVVGLILGAGLPALFAVGLVFHSAGAGDVDVDGAKRAPNPALRFLGLLLFAFVGLVIVAAILWITRTTVIHHFDVDMFPFIPKK